ncbi:hypothetical protein RFI_34208, partial [Reticulomyxa filosa]
KYKSVADGKTSQKNSKTQPQISVHTYIYTYIYMCLCLHYNSISKIDGRESIQHFLQTFEQATMTEYIPHMTIEEAENLQLHDFIDHRDEVGRYLYASIVEKLGSRLKVHYKGWSRMWDCYSDYKKEIERFAKARTISARQAHRFEHLKKGDFADINPKMRHPGWVAGEIRRKDKHSGQ